MALLLFAGIRVSDFDAAKAWYGRLLGGEPSFLPHATARKAIYRDADGNELGFGGVPG